MYKCAVSRENRQHGRPELGRNFVSSEMEKTQCSWNILSEWESDRVNLYAYNSKLYRSLLIAKFLKDVIQGGSGID